jgi:hypothetical protein
MHVPWCRGTVLRDRGGEVPVVAKKLFGVLAVAFAAFYLYQQPEDAAQAVRAAVGAVMEVFDQIVRFISTLFA